MEELVKHLSLFRYSNAITNMPVRRYSNFSVYFSQNSWFVGEFLNTSFEEKVGSRNVKLIKNAYKRLGECK